MESFFASLKMESVHHAHSRTCENARAAESDYSEVF